MSVHPRVIHKRRATITALPLYYSGHLLKKHITETDFKRYYGELRGATLFLYEDDTQDTYTEKLDLEQLTSMKLDSPYNRKAPTIFTLMMPTEGVQLKMENPDTGEEWRGYILTVTKKEIPSELQLLPGQLVQLQEVLDQERRRNPPMLRPPLPPRPSFLLSASPSPPPPKHKPVSSPEVPAGFFSVTRQEAERMLEANPEYGAMILRPSTLANSYALTLRQLTPSGPVIRNYRVTTFKSGFVIELDTPVAVSSLKDVLKYFLEKTEHRLRPYMLSQPYDTHIEVSLAPSINSPAPKTVPKAQVAPTLRSKTKEVPLPPPSRPVDSEYVVPDEDRPDDLNELKLAQLDGELQEALEAQRDTIYAATAKEEVTTYENPTGENCHSSRAQWSIKSVV
ncbi:signal-transducing adaptor protein 1-like [Chelmon rostratus]|uniref:signal-transducing adaptor protein 1-like n=1 Tax=Chelmon rostratus TaxID=109905 RepID=UPI001BEBC87E|nr:signal-transducing adaptor protein 1-like [Chelmon rostratus]XP_041799826.1 signal-transducing adaptor protein 1-like [Chelmon rostratus]XP_041799827.1 signal-transducing adaptor protein 1-like [Chelmon rostratus]